VGVGRPVMTSVLPPLIIALSTLVYVMAFGLCRAARVGDAQIELEHRSRTLPAPPVDQPGRGLCSRSSGARLRPQGVSLARLGRAPLRREK
jgi:hypothetical protein